MIPFCCNYSYNFEAIALFMGGAFHESAIKQPAKACQNLD